MLNREKKIRAFLLASGICGEADDKETKQRIEEYLIGGLWVEFPVRELGRILDRYHNELGGHHVR